MLCIVCCLVLLLFVGLRVVRICDYCCLCAVVVGVYVQFYVCCVLFAVCCVPFVVVCSDLLRAWCVCCLMFVVCSCLLCRLV